MTRRPEKLDRKQLTLEHIYRYRITVREILETRWFFQDTSYAAGEVLRGLLKSGHIQWGTLQGKSRYYQLTRRGARAIGINRDPRRASPDAVIEAYAILRFCCLREKELHKLTLEQFREQFKDCYWNRAKMNYYLDPDGDRPRLGYIRVDRGREDNWYRLRYKCQDEITKRCDLPAFQRIIIDGQFVLTLITAAQVKAERLKRILAEELEFPVPIRVHAMPELFPLVAPLNAKQLTDNGDDEEADTEDDE